MNLIDHISIHSCKLTILLCLQLISVPIKLVEGMATAKLECACVNLDFLGKTVKVSFSCILCLKYILSEQILYIWSLWEIIFWFHKNITFVLHIFNNLEISHTCSRQTADLCAGRNCSGNGNCTLGVCSCNQNYTGVDCESTLGKLRYSITLTPGH